MAVMAPHSRYPNHNSKSQVTNQFLSHTRSYFQGVSPISYYDDHLQGAFQISPYDDHRNSRDKTRQLIRRVKLFHK
jgi:hypothetical protein